MIDDDGSVNSNFRIKVSQGGILRLGLAKERVHQLWQFLDSAQGAEGMFLRAWVVSYGTGDDRPVGLRRHSQYVRFLT